MLSAVAGLLLGAAIAVRVSKRKQTGPPAPPGVVLAPDPAPKSDAERQLVRMAIGGAIAVVLAILTTVVTRPHTDDVETTVSSYREGWVTLTDGHQARALVSIRRYDRTPTDEISLGGVTFGVETVGTAPITLVLGSDSWLLDTAGHRFSPAGVLPMAQGLHQPGEEYRNVVFAVPRNSRPARLHLTLDLDGTLRAAEWVL